MFIWGVCMRDPLTPHSSRVWQKLTRDATASILFCVSRREELNVRTNRKRERITSVRGTHPVISSLMFALLDAFGSMSFVPLFPILSRQSQCSVHRHPARRYYSSPPKPSTALLPSLAIISVVLSSRDLQPSPFIRSSRPFMPSCHGDSLSSRSFA